MSISTLRRQVKNVALNYTDAQVKVREATSNDPWGPTTALMSEIADMTQNPMQHTEIMTMIWKRLNDHGKNWRHVYKSLVLLDYLIKCGSERVAQQCKENIFSIETLKDFQHIEENRDQGLNVRTKAKQMIVLLQDEEKLKNERARFMLTRKRFMQNRSSGIQSSEGSSRRAARQRGATDYSGPSDAEFEEARPSSLGEEEMQLQIALALSREECEKELELRRGDDIRLQIALEESKKEMVARSSSLDGGLDASSQQKQGTSKSQGDLLSLGLDEIFFNQQQQQTSSGASGPSTSAQAFAGNNADPWSPRPSTTIPMANAFAETALIPPPAQNDPWAAASASPPAQQQIPSVYPSLSTKTTKSTELEDILMAVAPQNDPWAFNSTTANGQAMPQNIATPPPTNGQHRNNVATPDAFLGENSSLVNLDNLLGPSNNQTQNQPKKATNPFLIGSTAPTSSAVTKNNPFMANERPSPSLNEMLQAKQQPPVQIGSGNASSTTTTTVQNQNSPFGPDGSLI